MLYIVDLASVARTSAGARSEPPTGTVEVTRDATVSIVSSFRALEILMTLQTATLQ